MTQVSAAANLAKKTERFMLSVAAILVLSIFISGVLFWLSKNQTSDIGVIQEELHTYALSETNTTELNQFVDANIDTIAAIEEVFPTNDTIVPVLKNIEAVVLKYDSQAIVGFIDSVPTKKNNELQIPMSINLTSDINTAFMLLRELEKLPLVLEVTNLNITNRQSIPIIDIKAVLYVNDPFISPKQPK